jgi:hypothetical protein
VLQRAQEKRKAQGPSRPVVELPLIQSLDLFLNPIVMRKAEALQC